MASDDGILSDVEGGGDNKPATKGDEKKSKHLTVLGILVGLIALYLAYRYYENQKANAASGTAASVPTGPSSSAYDPSAGGGGSGYWTGGQSSNDNSMAGQLDSDMQALNNTLMSMENNGGPSGGSPTGGSSIQGATGGTSGSNSGNEEQSSSIASATALSTIGVGPSSQPIAGANFNPTQAQAAVDTGTLTTRAALASETPAAQETPAQRHAQEVANRGLRQQLHSGH